MACVEWALLCDLAYFDAYRNLCLFGVRTQAPVPTLPAGTRRFAIAARVVGLQPHPDVTVSVSTPDSRLNAKTCPGAGIDRHSCCGRTITSSFATERHTPPRIGFGVIISRKEPC
jgi:hypothetical protein